VVTDRDRRPHAAAHRTFGAGTREGLPFAAARAALFVVTFALASRRFEAV
jgi:hypothetical protein